MAEVRYLIYPGYVQSRNDGDVHYVGVYALARLYGLAPSQWRTYNPDTDRRSTLPVLGPRFDGNYTLPGIGDRDD